jgi:hypothetical protein
MKFVHTFQALVDQVSERRAKALPITEILKVSFGGVGSLFGGSYGFSQSLRKSDGVVWRPTVGAVCGGALGYTVGLFPYQAFGLLLVVDVAYTVLPLLKKPSHSTNGAPPSS